MPADAAPRTNWAGILTYGASGIVRPGSVEEAQAAVRAAPGKVRPLGSCHCFNDIADTTGLHISLDRLRQVVALDRARRRVTVEAGARYGDVGPWLHEQGFSLHNAASLPHITIAGAAATATHGSGTGNLATAVAGIEFVDAAGNLVSLTRDDNPDVFPGVAVNLGGLGVIVRLTLDLEPAFLVSQRIYRDLPLAALENDFDAVMSSGYSVSIFLDWRGETAEQLWAKSIARPGEVAAPAAPLHGARPATVTTHPVIALDPVNCTEQLGVAGPAYDRLPHFKVGSVPAGGGDIQAEFFVAREHAGAVVKALRRHADVLAPILLISEIRTVAADDLWLSTASGRPTAAFHFSFNPDHAAVMRVLPGLEAVLAPFDPRPHWGKLFTMAPERVAAKYPKMPAFRALLEKHDPAGRFRNAYLDRLVYGGG